MNSNHPLITIIASVYNGEKYLKECISSTIDQDYSHLQIIFVNDGSTDLSGEILDEYAKKDSRITVIHKENSGVSHSRNIALELAQGEYVTLLDQDDVLSKDYISYFYNLCVLNDADIALTKQPKKFFGALNCESALTNDHLQILSGQEAAIMMLYHKIVIAPWNKLVKRDIIMGNKIRFQTQYFNGEGFAFSVECFQNARKVVVGQHKVYNYRVGDPNSGASKFKEEYINSSLDAQRYIRSVIRNTSEMIKAWEFSNWHSHCDALNIMVGTQAYVKHPELYAKIKAECKENAHCAFRAPISIQQKFRGLLFSISPYLAARVINHFRVRKFQKED